MGKNTEVILAAMIPGGMRAKTQPRTQVCVAEAPVHLFVHQVWGGW